MPAKNPLSPSGTERLETLATAYGPALRRYPRPFEVLADGRRIVALGTAFDIRIDEERGVFVTLVEGRIAVEEDCGGGALPD